MDRTGHGMVNVYRWTRTSIFMSSCANAPINKITTRTGKSMNYNGSWTAQLCAACVNNIEGAEYITIRLLWAVVDWMTGLDSIHAWMAAIACTDVYQVGNKTQNGCYHPFVSLEFVRGGICCPGRHTMDEVLMRRRPKSFCWGEREVGGGGGGAFEYALINFINPCGGKRRKKGTRVANCCYGISN